MKLLPVALQKQAYDLAAHVLVYGLVKALVKNPTNAPSFQRPRIRYDKKGKDKRKSSLRGFYCRALDEAEKVELEEASHVEGIDEEIALLRVKLRELLEEQPERIGLHFEAANIIARLVKTRYQITKEQKRSLKEAIQKVLTEVAVPLGVGLGVKLASR